MHLFEREERVGGGGEMEGAWEISEFKGSGNKDTRKRKKEKKESKEKKKDLKSSPSCTKFLSISSPTTNPTPASCEFKVTAVACPVPLGVTSIGTFQTQMPDQAWLMCFHAPPGRARSTFSFHFLAFWLAAVEFIVVVSALSGFIEVSFFPISCITPRKLEQCPLFHFQGTFRQLVSSYNQLLLLRLKH